MNERIPCDLKAEVLHDVNEMSSPLDVFEKVMQLDKQVALIVIKTNRYAQQNGRNFVTNAAEMKAFLGMNYIMGVISFQPFIIIGKVKFLLEMKESETL